MVQGGILPVIGSPKKDIKHLQFSMKFLTLWYNKEQGKKKGQCMIKHYWSELILRAMQYSNINIMIKHYWSELILRQSVNQYLKKISSWLTLRLQNHKRYLDMKPMLMCLKESYLLHYKNKHVVQNQCHSWGTNQSCQVPTELQ